MQTAHALALSALAPLLAQAHQAQHEIDDAEVAAQNGNDEFERAEVHGRLSDVAVVECVSAGRDDVASHDADDEQDDQCKAELRVEREGVPEGGHGSCLLLLFWLPARGAQDRPLDIAAQFFAANASQFLDGRARLSGNPRRLPLGDRGLFLPESGGQLGRTSRDFAGSFKCRGHDES